MRLITRDYSMISTMNTRPQADVLCCPKYIIIYMFLTTPTQL